MSRITNTLALAILPSLAFAQAWVGGNSYVPSPAKYLYQSGTPVGIQSSGTVGNNGALSAISTFATTYPAIYLYFGANVICTVGSGGNAAGFYYTVMSSGTAGTIYNNVLVDGSRPVVIASPTAFSCTGPGAYTQVITSQNLVTVAISGGSMGANGQMQIYDLWSIKNSANGKIFNITFGGSAIQTSNVTTFNAYENHLWVYNTGQQNRQVASPSTPTTYGPYTTANQYLSIDTSASFNVIANATLTNAGDYVVLEAMSIWEVAQSN